MKQKKKIVINKRIAGIILVISILLTLLVVTLVLNNNNKVVGRIYFNKPVSWEKAYVYLCDKNGKELLGEWTGIELINEEDYIYYFKISARTDKKIDECKITFNGGGKYLVKEKYEGYNKIFN